MLKHRYFTYLPSADTPTNSANVSQYLGCGRRRPARIAIAYVTETPSADMMTGFAIDASSG